MKQDNISIITSQTHMVRGISRAKLLNNWFYFFLPFFLFSLKKNLFHFKSKTPNTKESKPRESKKKAHICLPCKYDWSEHSGPCPPSSGFALGVSVGDHHMCITVGFPLLHHLHPNLCQQMSVVICFQGGIISDAQENAQLLFIYYFIN